MFPAGLKQPHRKNGNRMSRHSETRRKETPRKSDEPNGDIIKHANRVHNRIGHMLAAAGRHAPDGSVYGKPGLFRRGARNLEKFLQKRASEPITARPMNRPDLPADTLQKNNLFFRQLLFLGILITDRTGHSQAIGLLRRSLSGRFDALRRTAPAAFPADRATQLEIMARGGPACAMHDGPAAGTRLSDLRSDCGRDSQRRHVENRRLFRKAGDPAERTDRFRSHPQGSV